MSVTHIWLGLLLAFVVTSSVAPALAQPQTTNTTESPEVDDGTKLEDFSASQSGYSEYSDPACVTCYPHRNPWFGGAEYRYIRPSFSEAVGFALVTDSFAGGFQRQVVAEELRFDYDSSARFFLGLHVGDSQDIRFSYWNLDSDVNVSGIAGAGQTIVDPFGNLGVAGSSISTNAGVNLNVFDLEYVQTMNFPCQNADFLYSAGLRFANVEQNYDSTIRNAGNVATSVGVFAANYDGVGPYFSLTGSTSRKQQFSLLGKAGAALLIGSYDVTSGVTIPGVATGGQSADRIRAVPILEGELGGAWHPTDQFTLSVGWLFQAWFNIGTSGGTFDGEQLPLAPIDTVFGQTDDADIMSFDGLFVRAEFNF
jgi:hypothetical protein